jgi:large subunit ribosomal protein L25
MKFTAYERTLQGTGASRRLRIANKVPGIVYGSGDPKMIELDHNALFFALKKEAFHSSLLDMELDGKAEKVLLRDYQMHAWKPLVLHVDFQRVTEKTKLRQRVPLHFEGEEESPAVKTGGCVVNHVRTELEIECMASALPEFIKIDLSQLEKDQTLHVLDLKLPAGVKAVIHGKINPTVVTASPPRVQEEEPETVAAPVVPDADAKAKPKKDEKQNRK